LYANGCPFLKDEEIAMLIIEKHKDYKAFLISFWHELKTHIWFTCD
jgi:hypothetical protein